MATSTRPRRAAAPASAEHPARSDDSVAKKPAAKKTAPAKKAAAAAAPAAPASRQSAASKKAVAPAGTPEREPAAAKQAAAKKSAPKPAPAPAKKRTPARDAALPAAATAVLNARAEPALQAEPASRQKRGAQGPAAEAAQTKARSAKSPATKSPTAKSRGDRAATAETTTTSRPAKAPDTPAPAAARTPAAKKTGATAPAKKPARGRRSPAATAASEEQGALPGGATTEVASHATPAATSAATSPPATPAAGTAAHTATTDTAPTPAAPVHDATITKAPARAADTLPALAHSAVVLQDGDHRQLRWVAGSACPEALHAAASACTDETGLLQLDNDDALPTLLREAAAAGHPLQVDPAAWQQLARRRDARQRLFLLEHAYPEGPASPSLQNLLRAPLAPFQAEGALFAACAGRALLADERGLGKTVQALAAAVLLHRHAGVERVLIHCSADQRLSWQREAARFLGAAAPEWRVVSDEPGGPHAEAIDAWKPGLVVIDEPARLARWDRIDAPFALVLCGTPLDGDAALAEALVDYLDRHREGPLARLRTRAADAPLDEALQALMLRRRRAEVQRQLPARVVSERVLPLGPLQRAVHDRAAASARAVLAGWRRTRHLPDAQQWELGSAMQAMRDACHRAEPGRPDSPLAEHTLSALIVLTSELLGHAGLRIAAIAPRPADAALIAERLAQAGQGGDRCAVVPAGAPLPDDAEVVIAIGMPWQTPLDDSRPRHWVHLLAEHSIDTALYDTRELRTDVASTPAEGGHHGFLHGAALQRYLLAAEAALAALPPAPAAAA
jgi:hypothetical protein